VDLISDTTYCLYIYTGIELFSYILDMSVDRAVIEVVVISDDISHESVTLDDASRVLHEVFEDGEFCLGELDLCTSLGHSEVLVIDRDPTEFDEFGWLGFFSCF
jgi:hypothetical protein